jgi:hypothetical protein
MYLGKINKDLEFVKTVPLEFRTHQLLSEDTYMDEYTGEIYHLEKGEPVVLQQLPFLNPAPVVVSSEVFLLPRECTESGTPGSFFVYARVPGGVYNQIQNHQGHRPQFFPGLPTFNEHIGERLVKEMHQVPKEVGMVIARFI